MRLRPVILGKHEPKEGRNSIEDEAPIQHLDPAEAEIALHLVDHIAPVIEEPDGCVDEIRMLGRP